MLNTRDSKQVLAQDKYADSADEGLDSKLLPGQFFPPPCSPAVSAVKCLCQWLLYMIIMTAEEEACSIAEAIHVWHDLEMLTSHLSCDDADSYYGP